MTGTARIPGARITGVYGNIVKMVMRKMVGSVPESAEVLWNHPAAFKDSMKLGGRIEKWNELDKNLASYASMAAAAEIGCSFCLDLGYFMAHNKGLDETKAREVPRWRESDVFTPLERQVMEYAVGMCQLPVAVTDEMSDALLAQLGPAAMVELASRVGFTNLSGRTNVALGIRSAEFADACGLKPLAVKSSV